MALTTASPPSSSEDTFRHEALLYADRTEFLRGALAFIQGGLAGDEPMLVAVPPDKIDMLRAELGADADRVRFEDMTTVGRNPARIISVWRDFVTEHCMPDRRVRGIGEPIWAERSPAELVECERHEALLNLAFADLPAWSLLCPYDVTALAPEVIDRSCRHHPLVRGDGDHRASDRYAGAPAALAGLEQPLPEPPPAREELAFTGADLSAVRRAVARMAERAGLTGDRSTELVLAVDELATNSVRHGGGGGVLLLWCEGGALVCEVRDRGHIADPLVGRRRPLRDQPDGRGLWLVNELCDLVQLRSSQAGTVVRVRVAAG
ncbi:anti-sigma factor RsbA family regulatory protein [Gandjariella thermophila]|uniref:anti-sigma factor RsbA family regulatory protein n=1 Tax=Gandjariella thermophila TaxID=1931992 RepID=UPI001CEF74A4